MLNVVASFALGFAAPAAAHASAAGGAFTAGRLWATIDAVVGLAGAILASRALSRSARGIGHGGRNGAIVAMVVGLIVIAYAGLHLTIFTGGFGSGSGRA